MIGQHRVHMRNLRCWQWKSQSRRPESACRRPSSHACSLHHSGARGPTQPQFSKKTQKSLGVHKTLVRKIWSHPPPPRKGPKMRKNCTNQKKILQIDTLSGGGGTRFYGQNDFIDIWPIVEKKRSENESGMARVRSADLNGPKWTIFWSI